MFLLILSYTASRGSYGDAHYSQITGTRSIQYTLPSQLTNPFDFTHHYSDLKNTAECTCHRNNVLPC